MPVVAFEVLSATASHASRKPAAHADREGSTPFSEMLDKSAKQPDAKADSDTGKDAVSTRQSPASAKGQHPGKGRHAEAKANDDDTTDAPAIDPADDTTTDTASTDQITADDAFLAAVADATGVPVARPDADKAEAKSGDATTDTKPDKTGDKNDDATAVAVPAATDEKPAPVAAVVAAPAVPANDPTPADPAPASAPLTVATAVQGVAKADAKTDTAAISLPADAKADTKTETKADAPQAKLDTPPLLTPAAGDSTQTANPQAGQPQGLKPAADTADQNAKPAPARHDAPASDVAAIAKPADAAPPAQLLQANGLAPPQAADQIASAAPAATAPQAAALPVQGIAIEIAGRALEGKKTFDIRLDPPELGKIHVRLDVDHKGEVTSIITADRQDTFDMLRRDAQSLERALNDAGVKTSSNGLQFSLRDQGQQNAQPQFADTARVIVRDDTLDTEITAPLYRQLSGNRAGLDIRV